MTSDPCRPISFVFHYKWAGQRRLHRAGAPLITGLFALHPQWRRRQRPFGTKGQQAKAFLGRMPRSKRAFDVSAALRKQFAFKRTAWHGGDAIDACWCGSIKWIPDAVCVIYWGPGLIENTFDAAGAARQQSHIIKYQGDSFKSILEKDCQLTNGPTPINLQTAINSYNLFCTHWLFDVFYSKLIAL